MSQMHVGQAQQAICAPTVRFECAFAGDSRSLSEVRRWVKNSLPCACEAQRDAVWVAHELAANAIEHTASGAGGAFALDLSWWKNPDLARVVVADQGGRNEPQVISSAASKLHNGLLGVKNLSAACGHVGGESGRWVWADIPWGARGGQPMPVTDDRALSREELTVLRNAWPDTRVWLDDSVRMWCALPDDGRPKSCAPSLRALLGLLSARAAGVSGRVPQVREHWSGSAAGPAAGSLAASPSRPVHPHN